MALLDDCGSRWTFVLPGSFVHRFDGKPPTVWRHDWTGSPSGPTTRPAATTAGPVRESMRSRSSSFRSRR